MNPNAKFLVKSVKAKICQGLTFILLTLLCVGATRTYGYFVSPALSLQEMASKADIIFKGRVVSTKEVQDEFFRPLSGFLTDETQFKVISVIKGENPGENVTFRHYDSNPNPEMVMFTYSPQIYHFETGKTYLVFAIRSPHGGASSFQQPWMNHTSKPDEGVFLCADDMPVKATDIRNVIWSELSNLLKSSNASDVSYGIAQLDSLSGTKGEKYPFGHLSEFDAADVLALQRGLMSNANAGIAQKAIGAIGSHNPYMTDERAPYWLATIGNGDDWGLGGMDAKMSNVGGAYYWKDLVGIADSNADLSTRALAIRALGLVREPSLKESLQHWLKDPLPEIRSAATTLLADYPDVATPKQLAALASDNSPDVRKSAALCVGFGRQLQSVGLLEKLISDQDPKVRQAAAMSLLSFSPKDETVAAIFQHQLGTTEFSPLFLIRLARNNPGPWADKVAKELSDKSGPKNWWGGRIPGCALWNILFKYLVSRSPDEIRSEHFDSYMDALEKGPITGSGEPSAIYAFYISREIKDRAMKYRQNYKATVHFDMEAAFDRIDKNPALNKPGNFIP